MSRPIALKAYIAALTALGTWGAATFAPDDDGFVRVTEVEWFALLGVIVAGLTVWAAKNGEEDDPTTSTPGPHNSHVHRDIGSRRLDDAA